MESFLEWHHSPRITQQHPGWNALWKHLVRKLTLEFGERHGDWGRFVLLRSIDFARVDFKKIAKNEKTNMVKQFKKRWQSVWWWRTFFELTFCSVNLRANNIGTWLSHFLEIKKSGFYDQKNILLFFKIKKNFRKKRNSQTQTVTEETSLNPMS